jgi:hypothetical protein
VIATDLELVSYNDATVQGTVDSSGNITIDCGGPIVGNQWLLDHIAIRCNSLLVPYLFVYAAPSVKQITPQYVVDYTDSGNNDIAEYPQAQLVDVGERLILQWSGCSTLGTLNADGTSPVTVGSARIVWRTVKPRYE